MASGPVSRARVVITLSLALALCAPGPGQGPLFQQIEENVPSGSVLQAARDFDGDGDLDLLVDGSLAINDGDARFSPRYPGVFLAGTEVAAGDLNGDGSADLLVIRQSASGPLRAEVWLSDGAGIMTLLPGGGPATTPCPLVAVAHRIGLGDVDGDGDLDALVSQSYGCTGAPEIFMLWRNNGSGSFTDFSSQLPAAIPSYLPRMIFADFDLDQDLDILISSSPPAFGFATYRWHLVNDGTGTFTFAVLPVGSGLPSGAVAAGDVNGDGRPDVVAALPPFTGGWQDEVAFGAPIGFSSPFFTPRAGGASALVLMDVNGDGRDEVLRLGPRSGVFSAGPAGLPITPLQSFGSWPVGDPYLTAAAGDFDGDGDNDAVVCDPETQTATVLLNAGNGLLLEPPRPLPFTPRRSQIIAGDVEGDGDPDLVLVSGVEFQGHMPVAAINDGGGRFSFSPAFNAAPVTYFSEFPPLPLDADNDGDLDYYVGGTSPLPPNVDLLFTSTGTGFVASAFIPSVSQIRTMESGDIDGDGDTDVVLGRIIFFNGVGPSIAVMRNLGSGTFAAAGVAGTEHPTTDLALSDVDGDGDLDLFQANTPNPPQSHPSHLYRNDGTGAFSDHVGFTGPPATWVAAGDLDGDGDADVIFDRAILSNSGAGVFTPAGSLPVSDDSSMTLADVDEDGDLDVVRSDGIILANQGGLVFTTLQKLGSGGTAQDSHAVLDLDADGDLDLVFAGPRVWFNTRRQLSRGRFARLGRTASLEILGPPGSPWLLFAAGGPASFAYPPLGTVLIDPGTLFPVFPGTLDATGTAGIAASVPAVPALAGQSLFWQAYLAGPNRLTGRVRTTILNP